VNPVAPADADVIKETRPADTWEGYAYRQSAGAGVKPDRFKKRKGSQNGHYFFQNVPGGFPGERGKKMTTIKIRGMTCRHCVMAVTKALGAIDGIRDVQVDLEKGEAAFTEEKPVDRALIRERIIKAGFDVAD
jgi:copper chaperone